MPQISYECPVLREPLPMPMLHAAERAGRGRTLG